MFVGACLLRLCLLSFGQACVLAKLWELAWKNFIVNHSRTSEPRFDAGMHALTSVMQRLDYFLAREESLTAELHAMTEFISLYMASRRHVLQGSTSLLFQGQRLG